MIRPGWISTPAILVVLGLAMASAPGDIEAAGPAGLGVGSPTVVRPAAIQAGGTIDPRADWVLRQSSAYLAQLEHFTFHAEVAEDDWSETGHLIEFGRSVDIAVRRPDRMWADESGEHGHKRFWYDGSKLTLMDYSFGTYAQAEVPDHIDAMLETLAERYGVIIPLADFAFADLYFSLISEMTSGMYVGMRTIAGIEHHHLAFSQESIDWQIWISNGPRPLPAKLVITYKDEEGSPRFSAILSDWDVASPLPDALFDFEAPPGADRIDFAPVGGNPR